MRAETKISFLARSEMLKCGGKWSTNGSSDEVIVKIEQAMDKKAVSRTELAKRLDCSLRM